VPPFHAALVLAGFAATIAWLDLLAKEAVAIVESIGKISGISTSILGLTVIAVGNSVGDFVADTTAARRADARMAASAAFGSPLLMLMLGTALPCLLFTALNGRPIDTPISAHCRVAAAFLLCALASHAVAFPIPAFGGAYSVPRAYSFYLFSLYAAFLTISVLLEAGALPKGWVCSLGGGSGCLT